MGGGIGMEGQGVLSALSSFITEQEEWLENWLSALGWTKSSLQDQVS